MASTWDPGSLTRYFSLPSDTIPKSNGQTVVGFGAGAGGGFYITNPRSNHDLAGPFDTLQHDFNIYSAISILSVN